jgi:translocation and assembly module TamB
MDLGGSGASHLASITNGLKKTLGLSELNVESVQSFDPTANQNAGGVVGTTSLVVGKQIAKNLSVHYSTSLNLLNPVSTFNLRYKLSKRFSIQSETSTIDTGADLLYSIERD